jgi:hypothetical protein
VEERDRDRDRDSKFDEKFYMNFLRPSCENVPFHYPRKFDKGLPIVPVIDDEPSSLIAHTLASKLHRDLVEAAYVTRAGKSLVPMRSVASSKLDSLLMVGAGREVHEEEGVPKEVKEEEARERMQKSGNKTNGESESVDDTHGPSPSLPEDEEIVKREAAKRLVEVPNRCVLVLLYC